MYNELNLSPNLPGICFHDPTQACLRRAAEARVELPSGNGASDSFLYQALVLELLGQQLRVKREHKKAHQKRRPLMAAIKAAEKARKQASGHRNLDLFSREDDRVKQMTAEYRANESWLVTTNSWFLPECREEHSGWR